MSEKRVQPDPMQPSASLLIKLGSALVHFEEATEPDGHEADLATACQLATDPEVVRWREQMDAMALLPVKR